jgi:23S rRNA (guanosine2251-2'-O)-methyltransferase
MARKDRSSSRRPDRPKPRGDKSSRAGGDKPSRAGGDKPSRAGGVKPSRGGGVKPSRGDVPARAGADTPTGAGGEPAANLYGRNAVREALRGRRRVRRIWATKAAAREFTRAEIVTAEEVTARCGSDAHQGVCALADPYPYADAQELLAAPDPFLVALDEVTDPQNLGAVIRTAECAGATGVVIPERRSAEVTAAVAKASAGAVEHLPVARVRNLADFLAEAKEAGCWCYGAAAAARTPYRAVDWRGSVVLALGAEGRGLRPRVAAACDDLVSLPLRGRLESLNVSAAAAVLLYEILHQRLDAST